MSTDKGTWGFKLEKSQRIIWACPMPDTNEVEVCISPFNCTDFRERHEMILPHDEFNVMVDMLIEIREAIKGIM